MALRGSPKDEVEPTCGSFLLNIQRNGDYADIKKASFGRFLQLPDSDDGRVLTEFL